MARVGLISLGCAKNLVDSEIMLGALRKAGHEFVDEPEDAELLIINTCSFINDAKKESIEAIQEASERKNGGKRQKLLVAGCLAQRYADKLPELMPEVDAFIGLDQVATIADIVDSLMAGERGKDEGPQSFVSERPAYIPDYDTPHLRLTPKHSSFVKIAEGCNHMCAFCIIPRIRGRHRSRSTESILREARELVKNGCKEICLVSQDSTFYGMDKWEGQRPNRTSPVDSSKGESLASLLRGLNAIEGDFWIRVLYTHPAHWSEELMDVFAECEKLVKYVDVPLQHISDPMLKAMSRETDSAHLRGLVQRLRERIPGVCIRSTFIVGFPGETQADFDELMGFIKEAGFERGGVFEYSREEDTRAYDLQGRVHPSTRRKRRNLSTELLFNVASERGESLIGQRIRVLVESPGVARSQWDAPDVDGYVEVPDSLPVGEFAEVEIEDAVGYQLFAKLP
ncbi:MAG: 30S ribosomal protein S12 methylthiotransferase RimO [Opitutales bacterium]|nr:30S ribosomal protein S12 methylthiotransferase RimO [Opitutales bacterium]